MNPNRLSPVIVALAALEHKLDTHLFAREDEKESHTGRNLAIAGAGVGAAGLAGRSIAGNRTVPLLGPGEVKPGSPRSVMGRMATDGYTAGGTARRGIRSAARASASSLGTSIGNVLRQTGQRAKNLGRYVTGRGRLFSAGVDPRVLQLAAKADNLIQFEGELDTRDHIVRNLYGPIGVGLTSRKGKRLSAFTDSYVEGVKGSTLGALGGAGIGAGIGALVGGKGGRKAAAGIGAIGGGLAGSVGGSIYGANSKKARAIQARSK